MKIIFKPVYTCWVAEHPQPIGTIEFLGGALFGLLPTVFYSYFLRYFYNQGFTIVTSPFRLSLDHASVAQEIYLDRARVFDTLHSVHQSLPRFWVGHSLGCKYILLLEMAGELDSQDFLIKDQPSILIAPNISDTLKAVKSKWLAAYLDRKGCGVKPDRHNLRKQLSRSKRFNLSAVISFSLDQEAGTQNQTPEAPDFSDVALITQVLETEANRLLLRTELLTYQHLEPVKIGFTVNHNVQSSRKLEPQVLDYLQQLQIKTIVTPMSIPTPLLLDRS
jgi:Protein of unknown function (DUF1350)